MLEGSQTKHKYYFFDMLDFSMFNKLDRMPIPSRVDKNISIGIFDF